MHPKAIEDKEPLISRADSRGIFEDGAAGMFKTGLYTPKLAARMAEFMAQGEQEKIKSYGKIQSVELLDRSDSGGRRNYRYRITYENKGRGRELFL